MKVSSLIKLFQKRMEVFMMPSIKALNWLAAILLVFYIRTTCLHQTKPCRKSGMLFLPERKKTLFMVIWIIQKLIIPIISYVAAVSYTHLRAHETDSYLVCRLL